MAGRISWRQRAVAAATVAVGVVALAACGADAQTPPPAGSTPTGDGQIGGAATGTASPGVTPSQGGGGNNAPSYPMQAKAYAQELLKAWGNRNYTRLAQLAVSSAVAQVRDSVNSEGVPNTQWSYLSCRPSTDSTTCTFANANGDKTMIDLTNAKLGAPMAVTAASLDRTRFAKNWDSYVTNFVVAWGDGNYQRVAAYSSQSIANYFKGLPKAITSYSLSQEGPGNIYVRIAGIGDSLGQSEVIQIDEERIKQGKNHGITKAGLPG